MKEPTTEPGRILVYIHGALMLEPVLAIEEAAAADALRKAREAIVGLRLTAGNGYFRHEDGDLTELIEFDEVMDRLR